MHWIEMLVGETRGRLLEMVREGPSSIRDLAADLGITDNAVRGHVAALERDGLLRVRSQRATGGKPARLYELSERGEELFPKAYAAVLSELIETLAERIGPTAVREVMRDTGHRLGTRAVGGSPRGVSGAVRILEQLGGSIEVVQSDSEVILRSAGCPLGGVVAQTSVACALVEALVSQAAACEAEEVCDRSGRPRCAFRIKGDGPVATGSEEPSTRATEPGESPGR